MHANKLWVGPLLSLIVAVISFAGAFTSHDVGAARLVALNVAYGAAALGVAAVVRRAVPYEGASAWKNTSTVALLALPALAAAMTVALFFVARAGNKYATAAVAFAAPAAAFGALALAVLAWWGAAVAGMRRRAAAAAEAAALAAKAAAVAAATTYAEHLGALQDLEDFARGPADGSSIIVRALSAAGAGLIAREAARLELVLLFAVAPGPSSSACRLRVQRPIRAGKSYDLHWIANFSAKSLAVRGARAAE